MGGDIEVFFGGGGGKVLGGKVQSPESRVQSPVQLLGYALFNCFIYYYSQLCSAYVRFPTLDPSCGVLIVQLIALLASFVIGPEICKLDSVNKAGKYVTLANCYVF